MAVEGFKRKLTAILSADVIGYSRLMRDDEEATVRDLAAHRVLISNIIQQNHGRVVDSPGDNILAEFASVVDAVTGAIKIQEEIRRSNTDTPKDRRMEFRIGINLGDVIEEEDRIYGDGVNIAARVEGLAAGGGIAISGTVYEHIKEKMSLGYHYLGEQAVKNISEPVRVYRLLTDPADVSKMVGEEKPKLRKWLWAASGTVTLIIFLLGGLAIWNYYFRPSFEPASVEKMAFPFPEKPSIAVLPFDNMSGDPEQNYFSDGLTEQLISALSKVEYLFVIARNSTFTYKGKPVKVNQVAEELGVRYVMEGSVQKAEDRLRITVQLIDALKGHHLWSESYDRELKDIFDLQDEITMKVVTAMRVKLTAGEQARVFGKGTKNLKAYLKHLEAVEPYWLFKKEDNVRAKQLLEEAISLDPEFAVAYTLLAFCHINNALYGWSKSPPESMQSAFQLAEKAKSLDDSLPQPHRIKSIIYVFQKKHEEAIAEAQQAVEIYPNDPMSLWNLGWILRLAGRPEEAIPLMEKSIRLNPIPKYMALDTLGRAYFLAGKYEKAIAAYKTAVKLDPDQRDAHVGLAATYAILGREAEAHSEASEILRIEPNFTIKKYEKFMSYQLELEPEIEGLRNAGLPEHPPLKLPDKPSIAVLPFDNLSKDPEDEYIADGITEQIITGLSKVPDLFIISRSSTMTYKGKPIKLQQVSRELGVRYVLEGSVQKAGDRVRITAQLIDAQTDLHLWAERYDRDLKDIFALQDEITLKILTGLQIKLTKGDQARYAAKGTKNLEAYQKYMKGWDHFARGSYDDYILARQMCEEAIALDPEYPAPYVILGWTHLLDAMLGASKSPQKSKGQAFELGQKAIAMDDSDYYAYGLLGNIYLINREHEKAIAALERAVSLNPNYDQGFMFLGWTLAYAGRPQEGVPLLKKAMRLNPLSQKHASMVLFRLGVTYGMMGRYEEAVSELKKALDIRPDFWGTHLYFASFYIRLGREEEARAHAAELLRIVPTFSLEHFAKTVPYKNQADRERHVDALRKAGLK